MKKLKFIGYSDDTFGEYGVTSQDVDNCASGKPIQCLIQSGNGKLFVVGHYGACDGCWTIGVSNADEDIPIPDWQFRFTNDDCPYSPVLEIDVPDDVTLTWYDDMKEVQAND